MENFSSFLGDATGVRHLLNAHQPCHSVLRQSCHAVTVIAIQKYRLRKAVAAGAERFAWRFSPWASATMRMLQIAATSSYLPQSSLVASAAPSARARSFAQAILAST